MTDTSVCIYDFLFPSNLSIYGPATLQCHRLLSYGSLEFFFVLKYRTVCHNAPTCINVIPHYPSPGHHTLIGA